MSNDQEAGLPELGFEAYARWRASEVGKITEQLERRLIIELVGDVDGRKILDLGCGGGDSRLILQCEAQSLPGLTLLPQW